MKQVIEIPEWSVFEVEKKNKHKDLEIKACLPGTHEGGNGSGRRG